MTSFIRALLLACLMLPALSFAEEVQLQLSPVERVVDYEFSLNFSQMIPGIEYTGFIRAKWAAPDSALSGLDGRSLKVKVTASAEDGTGISFPASGNAGKTRAIAYLQCDVRGGKCAQTSVLYAEIPVAASVQQGGTQPRITLNSEIEGDAQGASPQEGAQTGSAAKAEPDADATKSQAEELFQSLTGALSGNATGNNSSAVSLPLPSEIINFSANGTNETFLDSLKPEGNPRDPVGFLKGNPLITLTALVIVIIVTGAYLLRSKD